MGQIQVQRVQSEAQTSTIFRCIIRPTIDAMNWLDNIDGTTKGLVPVIAQTATGDVLMFAWMNREALQLTARLGRAVCFNRSRQAVYKVEESDHVPRRV
jgi:phosphoribosyl-AMP cyclohydrolase